MTTTSKWYEIYKVALLETDWSKMEERIQAAEAAIRERKLEFDLDHGGNPTKTGPSWMQYAAWGFLRPK